MAQQFRCERVKAPFLDTTTDSRTVQRIAAETDSYLKMLDVATPPEGRHAGELADAAGSGVQAPAAKHAERNIGAAFDQSGGAAVRRGVAGHRRVTRRSRPDLSLLRA